VNAGENPDANRIVAGSRPGEPDSFNLMSAPLVHERTGNFGFGADSVNDA
jgi:hypothetical protein